MKNIKKVFFVLLMVSMIGGLIGCSATTQPNGSTVTDTPDSTATSQADGLKTIIIYPQPGVTNATVNGIPITTGQENSIQVNADDSLVTAKFTYQNSQGVLTETSVDLQTYYEFHVLAAYGGYLSTVHRSAFENDKTTEHR